MTDTTPTTPKQFRLIGLRVEDYRRISLVDLTFNPDGGLFALTSAKNAEGKSSIVDGFEAALAGAKATKHDSPIHNGAERSRIVVTFDDLIVERIFDAKGTRIVVKNGEGMKYAKAADMVAPLLNPIAFDALAFSRLPQREQVAALVKLVGFDPAAIDDRIRNLEATRTEVGRERDRFKGAVDSISEPAAGTPDVEQSAAALVAEREALAQQINEANAIAAAARRVREAVVLAEQTLERAKAALDAARAEAEAADAEAAALPDTAPLAERHAGIGVLLERLDETNAAVRAKAERTRLAEQRDAQTAKYKNITTEIDAARAEKAAAFAGADLPVDGLTIEDGVLFLNGVEYSEASTGEKATTAILIGAALNPTMRAMVLRDANTLDADNLAAVHTVAREKGLTVIAELLGEHPQFDGAVIEAGEVAETVKANLA